MIVVLLALSGAVAYGLSDFIGGLVARRTSPWPVALLAGTGALLGSIVLALTKPGDPSAANFAWAALAGVGSGLGSGFLYRGLAAGRMGVVAPISAVGAVIVPVAAGVLTGERPSTLVWLGIAIALPAIWLVSREISTTAEQASLAAGVVDGLLAGLGFGVLFAAIAQVPSSSGYWPLVATQVFSMVAVVLVAIVFRERWLPTRRLDWWGLVAGLIASLAVLCFLLATDRGLLTVSAVLTSLYPAFTVLLATLVLRERIHRSQAIGLLLCIVTVACVAAG